mmetsp:Transcript_4863/g.14800  ORF Transcript_4863/g.14800 Transcript_4863/m.14800 type:complete len:280 (-) Transcript_4863:583-1422(-)
MRNISLFGSAASTRNFAGRAPEFLMCSVRCSDSPERTLPKSTTGLASSSCGAKESTVFFVVQINGKSMRPVMAWIGKVESMSAFTLGVKMMVMEVVTPADMRPGGSNWISKKSRILSSRGSSLNWLNFRVSETFVTSMTCLYLLPTSKSWKAMVLGFARKASPFHSLPPTPCAPAASPCFMYWPVTTGSFFAGELLEGAASAASGWLPAKSGEPMGEGEPASRALAARTERSTFSISSGRARPKPKACVFCTVTLEGSMRTAVPVGSKTSTLSTVILRM